MHCALATVRGMGPFASLRVTGPIIGCVTERQVSRDLGESSAREPWIPPACGAGMTAAQFVDGRFHRQDSRARSPKGPGWSLWCGRIASVSLHRRSFPLLD